MASTLRGENLLVVAGPSACGKTTFMKRVVGRRRTAFAKKTLDALSLASDLSLSKLHINRVRSRLHSGEDILNARRNCMMHLDLSSRRRSKYFKICPLIFAHFQCVMSIQVYLSFDAWLARIQARAQAGAMVSRRARRIVECSELDYRRGKDLYRQVYVRWENYLDRHNVHHRITVDPVARIVSAQPPQDVRRTVWHSVRYALMRHSLRS